MNRDVIRQRNMKTVIVALLLAASLLMVAFTSIYHSGLSDIRRELQMRSPILGKDGTDLTAAVFHSKIDVPMRFIYASYATAVALILMATAIFTGRLTLNIPVTSCDSSKERSDEGFDLD